MSSTLDVVCFNMLRFYSSLSNHRGIVFDVSALPAREVREQGHQGGLQETELEQRWECQQV